MRNTNHMVAYSCSGTPGMPSVPARLLLPSPDPNSSLPSLSPKLSKLNAHSTRGVNRRKHTLTTSSDLDLAIATTMMRYTSLTSQTTHPPTPASRWTEMTHTYRPMCSCSSAWETMERPPSRLRTSNSVQKRHYCVLYLSTSIMGSRATTTITIITMIMTTTQKSAISRVWKGGVCLISLCRRTTAVCSTHSPSWRTRWSTSSSTPRHKHKIAKALVLVSPSSCQIRTTNTRMTRDPASRENELWYADVPWFECVNIYTRAPFLIAFGGSISFARRNIQI